MKNKFHKLEKYNIEVAPKVSLNIEESVHLVEILRKDFLNAALNYANEHIEKHLSIFIKDVNSLLRKEDRKYLNPIYNYFRTDLLYNVEMFLEEYLAKQRFEFSKVEEEIKWLHEKIQSLKSTKFEDLSDNERPVPKLIIEISAKIFLLLRPYYMFHSIIKRNAFKNNSYDEKIEHDIFINAVVISEEFVPSKEKRNITWEECLLAACQANENRIYKKIKRESEDFSLLVGRFTQFRFNNNIHKK